MNTEAENAMRELVRSDLMPLIEQVIMKRLILYADEIKKRNSEKAATAGSGEAVGEVAAAPYPNNKQFRMSATAEAYPIGTKLYAGGPPASGQGEALESLQEFVPYVQKHGHARKGYVVGMRKKSRRDELDEVETYYSKGAVLALVRRLAGGEGE